MNFRNKVLVFIGIAVTVGGTLFFLLGSSSSKKTADLPSVPVTRMTIVDKALAVGTIEPENEISVKSKVSGVVKHIFADAGTYVRAGQPLLEVRPDPSPMELAEAKRQVQLAQVEVDNLRREQDRQESLARQKMISEKELETAQMNHRSAELRLSIAKEHLDLLQSGKVRIEGSEIESIVKAPIDGYVLKKMVEVGDPVTPLTTYQEGTILMKMANMERLLFKGTVDEIDVGRLKVGMEALLKVGALPNDTVRGSLTKISLKAEKKENATVFPIEILIPAGANAVLRAGYSANANIVIQRRLNVLTLPERTVTFRNDSAFVRVAATGGAEQERRIVTGLSDAVNVEILSGLTEGERVLEKPVKTIQ